jgi:hypothetical protein
MDVFHSLGSYELLGGDSKRRLIGEEPKYVFASYANSSSPAHYINTILVGLSKSEMPEIAGATGGGIRIFCINYVYDTIFYIPTHSSMTLIIFIKQI